MNIENLTDEQLQEIANALQQPIIPENSIVRKLSIELFGDDNLTQMLFVGFKIAPELAKRMQTYKEELNIKKY